MTGSAFIRHLSGTANSIYKPQLPNMGHNLPQALVQRCSSLGCWMLLLAAYILLLIHTLYMYVWCSPNVSMTPDLDSAVDGPVHDIPEDGRENLGEVPVHQHPAAQPGPGELCRRQPDCHSKTATDEREAVCTQFVMCETDHTMDFVACTCTCTCTCSMCSAALW